VTTACACCGPAGEDVELYGEAPAHDDPLPEIARALAALPIDDFVLDGEVVALDAEGRPSFQLLQARMGLSHPRDVERAAPLTAGFGGGLSTPSASRATISAGCRSARARSAWPSSCRAAASSPTATT